MLNTMKPVIVNILSTQHVLGASKHFAYTSILPPLYHTGHRFSYNPHLTNEETEASVSVDICSTACKQQRWDLSPGSLVPAPLLLATILCSYFWILKDMAISNSWKNLLFSKANNLSKRKVFKQTMHG